MPLRAGDRAPDFILPTQRGVPVSLRAALAAGPVVLVLERRVRAARRRLEELRDALAALRALNATLLVVADDRPDRVKRHIEETGLPFNILVDPAAAVHRCYRAIAFARGPFRQVRVTTFVVTQDGTISDVFHPGRDGWGQRVDDISQAIRESKEARNRESRES